MFSGSELTFPAIKIKSISVLLIVFGGNDKKETLEEKRYFAIGSLVEVIQVLS